MWDFPIFTTENGVGSITLKEIPYKGVAYIKIQSSQAPEAFLAECVDFCKMAGAQQIYASGHEILEQYPLHTAIVQMSALKGSLAQVGAALFPLTEKTADHWRSIYNEKMRPIHNAATMTREDVKDLIAKGGGYFVHREGELLGIGIVRDDCIDSVISVKPGAGREVMLTLCSIVPAECVILEVASTNAKALHLYEKLGFIPTQELSRWYDVL